MCKSLIIKEVHNLDATLLTIPCHLEIGTMFMNVTEFDFFERMMASLHVKLLT
jgi:hypothetical protein